jgi:hypothetical protein
MSRSASHDIMRTLRPMLKGFQYFGWTIEYPTLGTNHRFRLVDPRDNTQVHLFAHLGDAKRFAEKDPRLTTADLAPFAIWNTEKEEVTK